MTVWEAETLLCCLEISFRQRAVTITRFSPNGRLLLVGSEEGSIDVYDCRNGCISLSFRLQLFVTLHPCTPSMLRHICIRSTGLPSMFSFPNQRGPTQVSPGRKQRHAAQHDSDGAGYLSRWPVRTQLRRHRSAPRNRLCDKCCCAVCRDGADMSCGRRDCVLAAAAGCLPGPIGLEHILLGVSVLTSAVTYAPGADYRAA